jgi:hypothetical protein
MEKEFAVNRKNEIEAEPNQPNSFSFSFALHYSQKKSQDDRGKHKRPLSETLQSRRGH